MVQDPTADCGKRAASFIGREPLVKDVATDDLRPWDIALCRSETGQAVLLEVTYASTSKTFPCVLGVRRLTKSGKPDRRFIGWSASFMGTRWDLLHREEGAHDLPISGRLSATDIPEPEVVAEIIAMAGEDGLRGFGGDCAAAAIAINRVVFDGRGRLVAAFNEAFMQAGHPVGHVAVETPDGRLWDADARPKTLTDSDQQGTDLLRWGRLDYDDPHYRKLAAEKGIFWTAERAAASKLYHFELEEDLVEIWGESFGESPLSEFERALAKASHAITGRSHFPLCDEEELDLDFVTGAAPGSP